MERVEWAMGIMVDQEGEEKDRFLAVWSQVRYLKSLSQFLICKMGTVIQSPLRELSERLRKVINIKHLAQCLASYKTE